MHGLGINGKGELRRQLANPGLPGKMAVKMECVCNWNSKKTITIIINYLDRL